MSDNDAPKGKTNTGWTDRERLTYLVNLVEHSGTKLNFKTASRPAGRSVIACERMVGRLKDTLKAELEALKRGAPMPGEGQGAVGKKTATPRKRKGREDGKAGPGGGPAKKGKARSREDAAAAAAGDEDQEEAVKSEGKKEEEE